MDNEEAKRLITETKGNEMSKSNGITMDYEAAAKIAEDAVSRSGPWNGREHDYARRAAWYALDRAEPSEQEKACVVTWAKTIVSLGYKQP